MKQQYRLNESELRSLITECVQEVLNEESNEGFVGDMFRGIRQGVKNYNAGVNTAKANMKSAKSDYKAATKMNKNVVAWITKDTQTLADMEQRYSQVYPQISKSIGMLRGSMQKAASTAETNAKNASETYNNSKTDVQNAKTQRSQNLQNRISNAIYPNQMPQEQ